MSFVSLPWLGWMVATVALFWGAPERARPWVLVGLTALFLGGYAPLSLLFLAATVALLWFPLQGVREPTGRQVLLPGGLVLAAFVALRAVENLGEGVLAVAMPLGLAYYTLRALHYLQERYLGRLPAHGLADLVAYLFFLPTLVVGPIHRMEPFLRDQRRHRWNPALASEAMERMVLGYAKVVVVGNFLLGEVAKGRIAAVEHDWLGAYLEVVRYAFHLYAQFSGYSDVAIGFALMLGFRVMENFDRPFLAGNISDFWSRWHISLTTFVRDNIYMVVVASSRQPALAAVASMVAMGIWHELSVRYLLWGVYHGAGIALWQAHRRYVAPRLGGPAWLGAVGHVASVGLTFHFVAVGFTLVAGSDTEAAWARLAVLFGG